MNMEQIQAARDEGRDDVALALLLAGFDQVDAGSQDRGLYFITMFEWKLMIRDGYTPAREAMLRVRDEQLARLLAGELHFGAEDLGRPGSRFEGVTKMNQILNDSTSDYDTFIRLLDIAPDVARQHAFRVLPAMVEAGDYVLAEGYLNNPLEELSRLNALSHEFPLYPQRGHPPRLWAELHNFAQSVALLMAVHRGLGRESEAVALRNAALAGLEKEELRVLAQREIDEPGVMLREIGSVRAENEE